MLHVRTILGLLTLLFLLWEVFLHIRQLTGKIERHEKLLRALFGEPWSKPFYLGTKEDVVTRISESVARGAPPSLKRVIWLSMWLTREFTRDVVGLSDIELEQVKDRLGPDRLWVAQALTIEEWATHTVVCDWEGHARTTYLPHRLRTAEDLHLLPCPFSPHNIVLWSHRFGSQDQGHTLDGVLEVVLEIDTVRCWRHGARFGDWVRVSEENIFVTIPINDEGQLRSYLELGSEDGRDPADTRPIYKRYQHIDPKGFGWAMHVTDIAAWFESRLQ